MEKSEQQAKKKPPLQGGFAVIWGGLELEPADEIDEILQLLNGLVDLASNIVDLGCQTLRGLRDALHVRGDLGSGSSLLFGGGSDVGDLAVDIVHLRADVMQQLFDGTGLACQGIHVGH